MARVKFVICVNTAALTSSRISLTQSQSCSKKLLAEVGSQVELHKQDNSSYVLSLAQTQIYTGLVNLVPETNSFGTVCWRKLLYPHWDVTTPFVHAWCTHPDTCPDEAQHYFHVGLHRHYQTLAHGGASAHPDCSPALSCTASHPLLTFPKPKHHSLKPAPSYLANTAEAVWIWSTLPS